MIGILLTIFVQFTIQSSMEMQVIASQLEDSMQLSEICFYSFDKSKCPPNINKSNMFGPNEYNSLILSLSKKSVIINIVETITLLKPLIFSAPARFYIRGYPIDGKIVIYSQTSVDIQDPTKSDFTLYWSVKSKEIAKLNTNSQAKSICIQIIDQNDNISHYSIQFYTGKPTSINLSNEFYKNNRYLINISNKISFVVITSIETKSKKNLNTDSGSLSDKVTYSFDNFQLKIEGNGDMIKFQSYLSVPWYSYRNQIDSVIISDGITSISDYSFYECMQITNITISSDITSIGISSFSYCCRLSIIKLPEKVESIGSFVFSNCKMLTCIYLPYTLSHIPDHAFLNCYNLLFLDCHYSSITSIGEHCFSGCIKLSEFYAYNIKIIPDYAFFNCSSINTIEIPEATSIGNFAFFNCSGIDALKILKYVEYIGKGALVNIRDAAVTYYNPAFVFKNSSIITKNDHRLIKYLDNDRYRNSYQVPTNVTSIEDFAFYSSPNLVCISLPPGVESIGSYAFYNCTKLAEIIAPELITINEYAFGMCTSLESFTVLNLKYIGQYAFLNCTKMPTINLSNAISIGDHAFDSCYYIDNLNFSNCLSTIGKYAFLRCYNLHIFSINPDNPNIFVYNGAIYNSVDLSLIFVSQHYALNTFQFHENVKSIVPYSFYNCTYLNSITIPEQISEIGDYAFAHCYHLKSVEILGDLLSIGNNAFRNCVLLETLIIPKNLVSIGHHAFAYCKKLTNINLPDNVNLIGESAFYGCINLKSFKIPDNVHSIEKSTFGFCDELESLNIEASIDDIKADAFANITGLQSFKVSDKNINYKSVNDVLFSKNGALLISYPPKKQGNTYIIPEGVTSICDYAFNNCDLLLKLTIPESISIGNYAFYKSGIESIQIPGNLIEIGKYIFSNCTNLKSAIILNGTTLINEGQFYGCKNLIKIDIPDSITNIGSYAFYFCQNLFSIELTNNIRYIGEYTFGHTYKLKSITFPDSLPLIDDYLFAFSGIEFVTFSDSIKLIGIASFLHCKNLDSVIMPPNIIAIGSKAFSNCISLHLVNLSTELISISSFAFEYNYRLSSIILNENVKTIGYGAFAYSYLETITIYSNLTYIAQKAFYNYHLYHFIYYGYESPKNNERVFNSNSNITIYIKPEYQDNIFCELHDLNTEPIDKDKLCLVDRCELCYPGKPLLCQKCNTPYPLSRNNDECTTLVFSRTNNHEIHKEIDENLLENGQYLFDATDVDHKLKENESLILNLNDNEYFINCIIINNPSEYNIGINISDNINELFIFSKCLKMTTLMVYSSSENLKIHLDSYIKLSFYKPKGKIEVINDKYNTVNIHEIILSSDDFIINEGRKIDLVALNIIGNLKINFNSTNFWNIRGILLTNATVHIYNYSLDYVEISPGSELIIDKSVLLSEASFGFVLDDNVNKPYLKGSIRREIPYKVIIYNETEISNNSKLIVESDEKFFCNAWNIDYDYNGLKWQFQSKCNIESSNGNDVIRLYLVGNQQDFAIKKDKIRIEIACAIIAGTVAIVAIIVSIVVYYCVIKKNHLVASSS